MAIFLKRKYKKTLPEESCTFPPCHAEGCQGIGLYKAPRSRDNPRPYLWFCLEHVRRYNTQWNYYSGLSVEEIEALNSADRVGRRPTWPIGNKSNPLILEDLKAAFSRTWNPFFRKDSPQVSLIPQEEKEAAKRLGLAFPFTLKTLKQRYTILAKQHHPDLHPPGEKKSQEEIFKTINRAYSLLSKSVHLS